MILRSSFDSSPARQIGREVFITMHIVKLGFIKESNYPCRGAVSAPAPL